MSKQKKPIRVLNIVGRMDRGGIETLIMNLYRNIDRDKVQFDFLAHYGREATYNDEIRSLGGCIYEMPALKKDDHQAYYWKLFTYIIALNRFFKERREYKIIHGHMTNTAAIYMPIAKKYGVTCRIAHSHNTRGKDGLLGVVTKFLHRFVYKNATDWFSCSKAASYWFYPKEAIDAGKITIVANAVDADRFRFSPSTREKMRKALGLEDKVVIGCVARFRPEKNHIFLVEVLQEVLKREPRAVLLFAGEGSTEDETKKKAMELGLQDHVFFLGARTDIPDILQAMDVFVLASLWEGLPVSGIEAQAAGLHCVVSDGVTDEMNVIGMVEYLPLDATKKIWADALLDAARKERHDTYEQIKTSGYDIHTTASWLQQFYLDKYDESISQ